jgi:hypothetical protein
MEANIKTLVEELIATGKVVPYKGNFYIAATEKDWQQAVDGLPNHFSPDDLDHAMSSRFGYIEYLDVIKYCHRGYIDGVFGVESIYPLVLFKISTPF